MTNHTKQEIQSYVWLPQVPFDAVRLLGESEKVSLLCLPFYAFNSHFYLLYQHALKTTDTHFPDRFRSQKAIPIFPFERLLPHTVLQSPHQIPPLGMLLQSLAHTHISSDILFLMFLSDPKKQHILRTIICLMEKSSDHVQKNYRFLSKALWTQQIVPFPLLSLSL